MKVQDTDFGGITPSHGKGITNDSSDAVLVQRVRDGEIAAFEVIMRRYNQRLYRIARSIVGEEDEAQDVVQETYVRAYYQLDQFRGPDGFAGWLSRIASNEAMMRLRKSRRLIYSLDDPDGGSENMESDVPQPIDGIARQQLRELLEDAIDSLPTDLRSVYVMRAIQQLSTAETANSLDVSTDVVKTRYLRARRALRSIFTSHISKAELTAFEFAGQRCDAIVQRVLLRLQGGDGADPGTAP